MFMLKYNWIFVFTHVEWLPRKIHMIVSSRGVHAVRDQYAPRHAWAIKASVALLFYMPIMGMIGIGIVLMGNNIVTTIIGGSIALISWFVPVVWHVNDVGLPQILSVPAYKMHPGNDCVVN